MTPHSCFLAEISIDEVNRKKWRHPRFWLMIFKFEKLKENISRFRAHQTMTTSSK